MRLTLDTPLQAVALQFGVGNHRSPLTCFLKAPRPFETALAALRHLAHEMLEPFQEGRMHSQGFKEPVCCAMNRFKYPSSKFCSDCGEQILLPEFCGRAYQNFVVDELSGECAHDYGDNWSSFDSPDEVLRLPSESVLVAASGAEKFLFVALKDDRVSGLTEDQNQFWENQQIFEDFRDFEDRVESMKFDWVGLC